MVVNVSHFRESYCLGLSSANKSVASPDPAVITWAYLAGALCCLGTIANALVLLIIVKFPSLRRGSGVFIAHLLSCHLVLCVIAGPIYIHLVYQSITIHLTSSNCEFCLYYSPINVGFSNLVNWTDAMLAVNRLVAVYFPVHYRIFSKRSFQCLTLGFYWLNACVISLPPSFEYLSIYRMNAMGVCVFSTRSGIMSNVIAFNSYTPLLLMTLTTVFIIGKLYIVRTHATRRVQAARQSSTNTGPAQPALPRISQRRKRTSYMLVAAFIISLTCQVSLNSVVLTGAQARYPKIVLFSRFLSLVQYTATPMVFLTMNPDYQNALTTLYGSFVRRLDSSVAMPRLSRSGAEMLRSPPVSRPVDS